MVSFEPGGINLDPFKTGAPLGVAVERVGCSRIWARKVSTKIVLQLITLFCSVALLLIELWAKSKQG